MYIFNRAIINERENFHLLHACSVVPSPISLSLVCPALNPRTPAAAATSHGTPLLCRSRREPPASSADAVDFSSTSTPPCSSAMRLSPSASPGRRSPRSQNQFVPDLVAANRRAPPLVVRAPPPALGLAGSLFCVSFSSSSSSDGCRFELDSGC